MQLHTYAVFDLFRVFHRVHPKDQGLTVVRLQQAFYALPHGGFTRAIGAQEAEYLAEIDRDFDPVPRVYLPLLPHDVHGPATLRDIGEALMQQIERV